MTDAPGAPWLRLAALTPARIALGRVGAGLSTRHVLAFALAHARARDAVHSVFDPAPVHAGLAALGLPSLEVASAAATREAYLLRPDLGRRLSNDARTALEARDRLPVDVAVVIADGLSAAAVQRHALPLVAALAPGIAAEGWRLAPIVLAHQARVALGDEIGWLLGARVVLMLIGERPGLSSPDSLGIYLTFAPQPRRTDGERNCISNIHAGGLGYGAAAFKALWLLRESLRRGLSGVDLKDESDAALVLDRTIPQLE